MSLYAHAVIEVDGRKFQRGDVVPDDLPGIEELREGGAVREEEYDPAADEVPAPDVVEIDGVKYLKASDGAESDDVRA